MTKTGRVVYRRARLQLLKKNEPAPDYASLAGMSRWRSRLKTGRSWAEWSSRARPRTRGRQTASGDRTVRVVARHAGMVDGTVTVGYERIRRAPRERGQRRGDGGYEASKSRTFNVPVKTLRRVRERAETQALVESTFTIRSAALLKRDACHLHRQHGRADRLFPESDRAKSAPLAVQHQARAPIARWMATKKAWTERFDRRQRCRVRSRTQRPPRAQRILRGLPRSSGWSKLGAREVSRHDLSPALVSCYSFDAAVLFACGTPRLARKTKPRSKPPLERQRVTVRMDTCRASDDGVDVRVQTGIVSSINLDLPRLPERSEALRDRRSTPATRRW